MNEIWNACTRAMNCGVLGCACVGVGGIGHSNSSVAASPGREGVKRSSKVH